MSAFFEGERGGVGKGGVNRREGALSEGGEGKGEWEAGKKEGVLKDRKRNLHRKLKGKKYLNRLRGRREEY